MRLAIVTALFCLLAAPAWSQVTSARPDKVAIVVYPGEEDDGLVLVTEQRTVDLPAGHSRISFRGVADGIVPQTVAVQGLPGVVAEQNFDYNLLTPGALIQASEGQTATLVRTNAATGKITQERARIVSAATGAVLDIDGRIEALQCSGAMERLVLDRLPPGFTDQPTLSVDTAVPAAGRYTVTLSYLALGVSWRANYVARLSPDFKRLDLTSWVTINNQSATRFPDAPVQVIAGKLERTPDETRAPQAEPMTFESHCWETNSGRFARREAPLPVMAYASAPPMMARAEEGDTTVESIITTGSRMREEDLGDYKLYTLPEPTTLAPFQTKQLLMFARTGVAVQVVKRVKLQSADNGWSPDHEDEVHAREVIRFTNDKASGLGVALPRGKVAVLRRFEGRDLMADEVQMNDTPTDLPAEFELAATHFASVHTKVLAGWRTGEGADARNHIRMEVTAVNADDQDVRFEIRENADADRFKVLNSSRRSTVEQGDVNWTLDVPARGEAKLIYTLEWAD